MEIGEAFFVGHPDLVEDRLVVDVRQPIVDLLRRQTAFLRDGDELRDRRRGDHHVLGDNLLHVLRRLIGDGGGARKKSRHGQSLTLDLGDLLPIKKPSRQARREQRRGDDRADDEGDETRDEGQFDEHFWDVRTGLPTL